LSNNLNQRLRRHTIAPPIMIIDVPINTTVNEIPLELGAEPSINTNNMQRNQWHGADS